jgi:rhodanese-related sulfurtransferase
MKLVYETGRRRLLGLQAVGGGEVVKRVDVFAGLLHRGGKLEDLLELEFCYAPPFNTALDPLHGLACAALNQEDTGIAGLNPLTDPEDRLVLDVRSPEEITEEFPSPPGAMNVPLPELHDRVEELSRQRPILVVCAMGTRSSEAARWLSSRGFDDVVYLAGGVNMRSKT